MGSSRSLKRKRAVSPTPSDDGRDRGDVVSSVDGDANDPDHDNAPLNPLHAISIGHLILDEPAHRMYTQHVAALLDACGTGREGSAQLQELIRHIHVKAEELELLDDGETAAAALTSAYCDRVATRLIESLASEEMLAEVTALVLQRRQYEVDSKVFLRSLKRKLRDTTSTSRELETNDTITETVPDLELPEPAAIARAVDLQWDHERLDQLSSQAAQTLVLSVIQSARDLFVVHQVADVEFEASQQNSSAFDLQQAIDQAVARWAEVRLPKKEHYASRYEALLGGDMRTLVSRRRSKSTRDLKEQYALRRQPLQGVAPAPVSYVHVKTESPSSSRNDSTLQHFVTQPPGPSISSHASVMAHPPPPSRVRQETPSQQVILLLNCDTLVYRMRKICKDIFAPYGYVNVKRIGQKFGPRSRQWLVVLRTAEQAEAAVSSGVRVPGQNGRMYVYRGE
ncbi:hypothetical protein LTR17_011137 [Elasticomyces elasticus]|nr:hypothetical protein LTR17_011137 [Elasticomyces elasticus]